MRALHALDTLGRGDETKKTDSLSAGPLERTDCSDSAPSSCQHWIKHEEISLFGVARNLEVVVNGFERRVIEEEKEFFAIEKDTDD